MIYAFKHTHFSAYAIGVLLGAFIAFVIAPTVPSWDDAFWRLHDTWNPVATIEATKLPSPQGEVRAKLRVHRHRGECKFTGPAAFEELPGGTAIRVFATRVDAQAPVNVPAGKIFEAEWRFFPVSSGTLRVLMEYLCDGRVVIVPVKGLP